MSDRALAIVCMAVGEPKEDLRLYVLRLYDMLRRHCRRPFTLYCYTDRDRAFPANIVCKDCSGWTELLRPGMRPTTKKLGLFNPDYTPFEEFLYLDVSLVIRSSMDALLDSAFGRTQSLVIVDDWFNSGYNSSVMRIRHGKLRAVYDGFVAGESFVQHVQGDQEFIYNIVTRRGLVHDVSLFPPNFVASFKRAARLCRKDAPAATAQIQNATIVKFHGRPKMEEAFSASYSLLKIRVPEILQGHWRPIFPINKLRQEWIYESRT